MSTESILLERHEGVATITLNRPDVLNSFDAQMSEQFLAALRNVAEDKTVRAVLLTGSGRGFCAGQDLAEFTGEIKAGQTPQLGRVVRERYNPTIRLIRETEKPFVCAVNGVAAGAGANLALSCDIVIAADSASFIQSFAKVGLIPDSGGTFILPRLVGFGRAQALTFLADKLSAAEAVQIGMIYKSVEAGKLMEESGKIVQYLASQPTKGLGLIKRAFNRSSTNDLRAQLDLEEELQQSAGVTKDYAEGVLSFMEKRAPKFRGE